MLLYAFASSRPYILNRPCCDVATPCTSDSTLSFHGVVVTQFFTWLESQRERRDIVGAYARAAIANICYPRSSRLPVLLKHEPVHSRAALKRAHREWRRSLKRAS